MRTIWKYELQITDVQTIEMPQGAKILTVQVQKGKPCIWVELNTEHLIAARKLRIFGTGHKITLHADIKYIGTFQVSDGELVFHLYE